MWAFPPPSNSLTPAVCPTRLPNSDTLPRVSARPHRRRTQSHKTAPHTSDVSHKSRLLPVLPTSLLQIRGSQDSFLKFDNSLERLTEHRETVSLLDYGSIIKETLYKSSRMERMRRTRYRRRACDFHALCKHATLPASVHSPT